MSTVAAVESFVTSIVTAVMEQLQPLAEQAIERAATRAAGGTRERLQIRELKPVMTYDETCEALHISRDHGDRLKKDGAFPVAPLNPPISTRDLYAGEDVIAAIRSRGAWQQSKRFLKGA